MQSWPITHLFQLFLLLTAISASPLSFLSWESGHEWNVLIRVPVKGKGSDGVVTHALVSLHILKLCAKRKCSGKITKGTSCDFFNREYTDVLV